MPASLQRNKPRFIKSQPLDQIFRHDFMRFVESELASIQIKLLNGFRNGDLYLFLLTCALTFTLLFHINIVWLSYLSIIVLYYLFTNIFINIFLTPTARAAISLRCNLMTLVTSPLGLPLDLSFQLPSKMPNYNFNHLLEMCTVLVILLH